MQLSIVYGRGGAIGWGIAGSLRPYTAEDTHTVHG
jgi:hypothetical protein